MNKGEMDLTARMLAQIDRVSEEEAVKISKEFNTSIGMIGYYQRECEMGGGNMPPKYNIMDAGIEEDKADYIINRIMNR